MGFLFVAMILFGIVLAAAPFAAGAAGISVGGVASTILAVFGIAILLLGFILLSITKLYVRVKASEAIVRTGMGGRKVILDGGAMVIPIVHEVLKITLETLKLEVVKKGEEAFITKDNLRCDIGAEFFVKVSPETGAVVNAAQSLGHKMGKEQLVRDTVEDKLISALRSVAATKTLQQLHTEREEFVKEVTKAVNDDLAQNGLTLESVTISQLDQTDVHHLKADNIFDAQGRRTIAEITERQKTERNQYENEGEQRRKQQDVETQQRLYELERVQAEVKAKQEAEVAKVQAQAQREAQEKTVEAQRAVELAQVKKQQDLEVAAKQREQAGDVAEEEKKKAIAAASQEKALAEAELAKAEAELQLQRERVKTVAVTEQANRQKQENVIAAQAKAESAYVSEQRQADAAAYKIQKDADAAAYKIDKDAQARKAAADADAEAKIKNANAEKEAALAKVDAERAHELVPVDVAARQVEVSKAQVEVDRERFQTITKPDLEAREEFGASAQEFELAKLRITEQAQVNIEIGKATASIVGKIEGKFFGTPEQVAEMTKAYMLGQNMSAGIDGFATANGMTGAEIIAGVKAVAAAALKKAGLSEEDINAELSKINGGLLKQGQRKSQS